MPRSQQFIKVCHLSPGGDGNAVVTGVRLKHTPPPGVVGREAWRAHPHLEVRGARDRWALRANGLSSFPVDQYSDTGITGQLREEAGPAQTEDKRPHIPHSRSQETSPTTHAQEGSLEVKRGLMLRDGN